MVNVVLLGIFKGPDKSGLISRRSNYLSKEYLNRIIYFVK